MARRFPSWRLRLALLAYGALWVVGLPLVLIYLWRRARKDADYGRWLAERFGLYGAPMRGAVWVHAVSLGEVRSAVPLIRALRAAGERVVVTHFTPAGRRETARVFAEDIAAGQMRAVWVPFELSMFYRGFWRAFAPKYGLVMEIEIWPRMIMAARAARVPLLMCNAQYPSKSVARDGRDGLLAQLRCGFAGALVKSDLQAARFAAVGLRNIAVTGELRFDQPIPPGQVRAGLALAPKGREVVVFASAVQGEDAGYICVIKELLADAQVRLQPAPLIVYVPRKPERFDEVAGLLTAAGLRIARRSIALDTSLHGSLPEGIDVFLGDSLGEMYAYLAMATRVVVGGGFIPAGAHNISEPLALKKPVLVGPETWTIEFPFVEAEAAGVARKCADFPALAAALIAPQDPAPDQIEAFFAVQSGATARTMAAIPQLLATLRP